MSERDGLGMGRAEWIDHDTLLIPAVAIDEESGAIGHARIEVREGDDLWDEWIEEAENARPEPGSKPMSDKFLWSDDAPPAILNAWEPPFDEDDEKPDSEGQGDSGEQY
ncbi:hypothetical protein OWR29_45295 [Actinoplanes sp. Pm04-4]|uniref:Uncharacterized protein n=1 Tax=Paractinoplanes pyxinae TaxID=2997416 RepID=A0ABT4BFL5_9ACTN|nr:hypothetical protein [Actinoplanes pyxinae]MCY1145262.1 hypothetical protein [Actinoplanes pyxinae]